MTELTFALLKYGFLILLWVFAWFAIRSLHKDISSFSPRPSRARRRKDRHAARRSSAKPAVPVTEGAPVHAPARERHRARGNARPASAASAAAGGPSLLVIIDGPLAGSSVPLTGETITLGRAASNTVVLDDEFVSSHHARIYQDPTSGQWAIEDLGSTNGTVVNGQRLAAPTVLPARMPVRIGATTFELR
ncbi:FHA domain-containing protein FhaB/FipA [Bifidobacterium saguinibicoloris]|uniref:FHA domain-containing protein FhaB/FipA n=1 Tax=Bifidobacterium saguinibicoloris TaxID=2834433 RepID=UPI001C581E30|nr:FHA domain-containing protein [Bifidobacterium saguinibicoloris]MBW3081471.1 FHA domain-containing protein [Bifidobacterium saguinibicoloris]